MLQMLFHIAIIMFFYMTFVFLVAQYKKNISIVDAAWGIGFIIIAWYLFFKNGYYTPRQIMVNTLVTIWGLRLSYYLFKRNWFKGEDPRYLALSKDWHTFRLLQIYLKLFLLQGLLIILISTPVILINASTNTTLNWLDFVGLGVWLIGFFFESVADYQLEVFLAQPENRGQLCIIGLRKYTQHPNYFGELCMWYGIFLIGLSVSYGLWGIISPITLTTLILFVSGIPLQEKQLEQFAEYAEWNRRTSKLIPWLPKQ